MARKLMMLFSIVGLAAGCARPHGLSDSPAPKPAEGAELERTELESAEEGKAGQAEPAVVGEAAEEGAVEAMVFPSSARVDEGQPRTDALRVQTWAPTPIGVLREDARESYRIVLQAENVSQGAVEVHPAWARARIHRRDRIVEGCLGEPVQVPETSAIGPEGSLFVSLPSPCALEEPGRYEVFVDLSIGVPFGADATAVRSARTEVVVRRGLEAFRGEDLPPLTRDQLTPPERVEE